MSGHGARALEELGERLRAGGGLLGDATRAAGAADHDTTHGDAAATGPRAANAPDRYALVVEAIREGYLLHYDSGRVVDGRADADLELLAGDCLYALGIDELAQLDDLEAVRELADLIAAAARVRAEGDAGRAEAVWAQRARAVGGSER